MSAFFFEGPMQAGTPKTEPRIETEIRRIRGLLERSQFAEAVSALQIVLPLAPDDRDLLYMSAIALRYLDRVPEALGVLQRLERTHPGYPRLYQERGHCYAAKGSAGPAIEAYKQAVKMSPSLVGSWKPLHSLYRVTGQVAAAEQAAAEIANLAKLPPEILTAYAMYADEELKQAEQLLRQYLLQHGPHVEGIRLLAQIGMRRDAPEDAEKLLQQAISLAPDNDAARYDYAAVLLKRHKHAEARDQLLKLLQAGPSNPTYRGLLATVYAGVGNYEKALPLYLELLRENPADPELRLSVAHALKTVGRAPEAIEAYRAAALARPRYGEAYWSLANLKTYRFTDAEIALMRADEAAPNVKLEDRYHLCFALGKALEDAGNYAESFVYYERGNALKKSETGYRPEPLERSAELIASVCTPKFFAERRGVGPTNPSPDGSPHGNAIFIVGLPRSGSTLLEQILASHSRVEGTMELADVPRMVQDLQGPPGPDSRSRYPAILSSLNPEDFQRLGAEYLTVTRMYRAGKPFFIDKMPNNFRHIGLIHLMLPNAKIIDARREPMACCFSNYKQLFAAGQHFTYSVDDITRYYRMYLKLMDHWDLALPGKVLRVQHENVVEDLEGSVRRILDFCHLDFEPDCLDFHKTRRDIHSASSEQVRQPINREGLNQWHHFEPWLGPLQAALAR
jgi:tetratricopeptide (TPR) repeat protein